MVAASLPFALDSVFTIFLEASLARAPKISPAIKKRAAQIKVILMDVDGTMTDGGVTLLSQAGYRARNQDL